MTNRDKIAVLGSGLLLLAILTAGAVGLFKAYRYNEAPPQSNGGSRSKSGNLEIGIRVSFQALRPRNFV